MYTTAIILVLIGLSVSAFIVHKLRRAFEKSDCGSCCSSCSRTCSSNVKRSDKDNGEV